MTDSEFMQICIEEARLAAESGEGGPFGAVVVRDGTMVARGHNRIAADRDPTAHGEIVAIRRAAKILGPRFPRGCVLYTSSQSCPMCLAAALWAGVERIYYGATCEDGHRAGLSDRFVYDYLRGGEDPAVLEQIQISHDLCKEQVLDWWERRNG
ncbi:MAG: nucleoside deaminase [Treponema sp.]|jgi:tRNA(Arg) A34 adenosine deaminase TadA|nr:nucleoside deaminase [Treponema sp.]